MNLPLNRIRRGFIFLAMSGILLTYSGACRQQDTAASATQQEAAASASDEVAALVKQLLSDDKSERMSAALELANHPDEAPLFLRPLAELLTDRSNEECRLAAVGTISQLGKNAVAAVRPMIESDDVREFRLGCEVVHQLGPTAAELLPELAKHIEIKDGKLDAFGEAAVYTLVPMGQHAAPYVRQLAKVLTLDAQGFHAVNFAFRALINLGPEARPAAPEIIQVANDGILSHRAYAYWTLGAIAPLDELDVTEFLTDKLDQFYQIERERALFGLGLIGRDAASAANKIRELALDKESGVQPIAAFTLWKVSGDADEAIDMLKEHFTRYENQYSVMKMLNRMGAAAAPAEEFLVGQLQHDDTATRDLVVQVLGNLPQLSPASKAALQQVAEKDDDAMIRFRSKQILSKLDK